MRRYELPFEVVEAAELEEVKGQLLQVLHSLNQKETAADLIRGGTPDLFYKVATLCCCQFKYLCECMLPILTAPDLSYLKSH